MTHASYINESLTRPEMDSRIVTLRKRTDLCVVVGQSLIKVSHRLTHRIVMGACAMNNDRWQVLRIG